MSDIRYLFIKKKNDYREAHGPKSLRWSSPWGTSLHGGTDLEDCLLTRTLYRGGAALPRCYSFSPGKGLKPRLLGLWPDGVVNLVATRAQRFCRARRWWDPKKTTIWFPYVYLLLIISARWRGAAGIWRVLHTAPLPPTALQAAARCLHQPGDYYRVCMPLL